MEDLLVNRRLVIPGRELRMEVSTSSGPGGQHVNRSRTRVTLILNVDSSTTIGAMRQAILRKRLGHRIHQDGSIRVTCGRSRSQKDNLKMARERLASLLRAALTPQRRRRETRPTKASRTRRLDAKGRRGQKKESRNWKWDDSG